MSRSATRDLGWLTGFTGSAGFCIVLPDRAGVFVDGRYRVQARSQCADVFDIVPWPETRPADWLRDACPGAVIGFDPWLHTPDEIDTLERGLAGSGITLKRVANMIDPLWTDRPAPPMGAAMTYPRGSCRAQVPQSARTLRKTCRKTASVPPC